MLDLSSTEICDTIDTIRTFYSDAATASAYLVHGKGDWLETCRCVVTAAIMHHAMLAARENRPCSLAEIQNALAEASRRIHLHNTIGNIVERTTQTSQQAEIGSYG